MVAGLALLLALAPMNPTPEESLTEGLLVCRQKPNSEAVECITYAEFQAALKAALLKSPKKGEL